jgi:hypothetical protein
MRFFLSLCAVSVRTGVGMRRFERRIRNQRCSLAIADTLRKTSVREKLSSQMLPLEIMKAATL